MIYKVIEILFSVPLISGCFKHDFVMNVVSGASVAAQRVKMAGAKHRRVRAMERVQILSTADQYNEYIKSGTGKRLIKQRSETMETILGIFDVL